MTGDEFTSALFHSVKDPMSLIIFAEAISPNAVAISAKVLPLSKFVWCALLPLFNKNVQFAHIGTNI